MNDWTKDCSTCRYASCPAPEACYCEMEREAHQEMRSTMRMLTFVGIYAVIVLCVIALAFLI